MSTLDPRALKVAHAAYWESRVLSEVSPDRIVAAITAYLAALSQPQAGEPVSVERIDMVDWSSGYEMPADPLWRIVLGGFCADFPTETAAQNFASAIMRRPSPQPALAVKGMQDAWTRFCDANPDDLTSPDDLPDHALMTCAQFVDYALSALVAPPPSGEVEVLTGAALVDALRNPESQLSVMIDAAADAALSSAPATADGWRGMEDAPKDGTKFDVWVPDAFGGHRMTGLSFNQKGKLRQNGLLTEADLPRWPTHWRPLPAAPTATGGR